MIGCERPGEHGASDVRSQRIRAPERRIDIVRIDDDRGPGSLPRPHRLWCVRGRRAETVGASEVGRQWQGHAPDSGSGNAAHDAQRLPMLVRDPVGHQSHTADLRVGGAVEEGDIAHIVIGLAGIDQGSAAGRDVVPEPSLSADRVGGEAAEGSPAGGARAADISVKRTGESLQVVPCGVVFRCRHRAEEYRNSDTWSSSLDNTPDNIASLYV